ncbi:hypothetical protein F5148DRAFT_644980 [Russula earlei]|uniref:Uncharacterized protein n=1 Tax=Russula earlei TaxID=71964 RepID=A0ACC0UMJ0_9AGAM|nr:hypothetical protein F5148DRAFT_644980 [Russula earlei]
MVDLGGNEKPRLLKRPSNLSQMLGEPPLEVTSQPHQARSRCSTPALEIPSTDHAHQHRQFSRFSSHSFMGKTLSSSSFSHSHPSLQRRACLPRPFHPLGTLMIGATLRDLHQLVLHSSICHVLVSVDCAERGQRDLLNPTRTLSVVTIRPSTQACLRGLLASGYSIPFTMRDRRTSREGQSVQNPVTTPNGHPQKSSDPSIPRHTQRRSTSFWIRMRTIKDEPPHQQHSELDQDQENDASR